MTHTAFLEYRYDASTLSASMMRVVRARLAGKTISREETGMSKREWNAAAPVFWTGG
jgi:thymidylate synthase (FAD)